MQPQALQRLALGNRGVQCAAKRTNSPNIANLAQDPSGSPAYFPKAVVERSSEYANPYIFGPPSKLCNSKSH